MDLVLPVDNSNFDKVPVSGLTMSTGSVFAHADAVQIQVSTADRKILFMCQ